MDISLTFHVHFIYRLGWIGPVVHFPVWGQTAWRFFVIRYCRDCYIIVPGLEKWEINQIAPDEAQWKQFKLHEFEEWRKIVQKLPDYKQDFKKKNMMEIVPVNI